LKTNIKYILTIPLSIILFLFSGCIDGTNYPVGYVNGTVYNNRGFPVNNYQVSIGDYPIINTNENGIFLIENVQKPYNLLINKNDYAPESYVKYLNLQTENPVVNSFGDAIYYIRFKAFVTFPPYSDGQWLLLKFIGDDSCYNYSPKIPWYPDDTTFLMNIFFKPGYTNTHGKMIYLLCTLEGNGDISSYDAFAVKDITLQSGTIVNVRFSKEETQFNPPEVNTHINIQRPSSIAPYQYIMLHFPGKDKNSEMELTVLNYLQTETLIPILPDLDYKIRTLSEYYTYSNFVNGIKWLITEPGEDINIIHKDFLKLLSPQNMEPEVNDTTVFSVENDPIPGVYEFIIIAINEVDIKSIVISDINHIKLNDFKSRGFEFKPDLYYYWYVMKYPNYNSIDNFASVNFVMDDRYDYIQGSEVRHFKFMPAN